MLTMHTRARMRYAHVLATVLLTVVASARPIAAQTSILPDPRKVIADFGDDAERFTALQVLSQAALKVRGREAYDRASAYHRAAGELDQKYAQQGKTSEAFRLYQARRDQLFRDAAFEQSVLSRYHLAGAGGTGAPAKKPPFFPPSGASPSDDAIKSAFLEASVVWVAGLIAMIVVGRLIIGASGYGPSARGARTDPALPEPLRVVSVPGRSYAVELESGEVVEKESTMETSGHTTTTGGQVHIQGGDLYQTPIQTHTTLSSTQKDVIWVRSETRESPWTLRGGQLMARKGHLLSRISRPLGDGTSDMLLAYNHTTNQLVQMPGVHNAHVVRLLKAWLAIAFLGSLPGAFGLGMMFHRLGGLDTSSLPIALLTLWIMGGFASALIAALVVLRVGKGVMARRNARFATHYLPQFDGFLAQKTPELAKRFAAR